MTLKEQSWMPYGKKAKFIEINVKNNDNQTIDFFKVFKENTRDIKRIVKKIKEKHEFDFNPEDEQESVLKKGMTWD